MLVAGASLFREALARYGEFHPAYLAPALEKSQRFDDNPPFAHSLQP